jgi:hypothetical protein
MIAITQARCHHKRLLQFVVQHKCICSAFKNQCPGTIRAFLHQAQRSAETITKSPIGAAEKGKPAHFAHTCRTDILEVPPALQAGHTSINQSTQGWHDAGIKQTTAAAPHWCLVHRLPPPSCHRISDNTMNWFQHNSKTGCINQKQLVFSAKQTAGNDNRTTSTICNSQGACHLPIVVDS